MTLDANAPRIGGRYVIGDEIGAGGLATVHIGREISGDHAGRAVAIKRLHPPLAREPDVAATLLDEGRIVARIAHPNVVRLFETIVDEGDIFLVLEYVPGESLSALMRLARGSGRRIPIDVACAIARDVLRGLHAAHQATDERNRPLGVVHRDVTPHNIQVGADGHTRLLDFGVAKAAGQSHTTRPGQIKGKLSYMAPEQLRGGLVTRRSDIYSAGIVIWEMLTLERPFGDPRDTEAMIESLSRRPAPPSSLAAGVPTALDDLVFRGLALDPSERYATADDMARDLERAHGAASPSQVAAWVKEIAGANLAKRAALLAKSDAASAPAPEKGFAMRAAAIGALLVLLALGVLVALRMAGR